MHAGRLDVDSELRPRNHHANHDPGAAEPGARRGEEAKAESIGRATEGGCERKRARQARDEMSVSTGSGAAREGKRRLGRTRIPHIALIIEDNPETAAIIAEGVRARGDIPWIVTNLEEVRAAIEKGGFGDVLLDIEIPVAPGRPPSPSVRRDRARLAARLQLGADEGRHVLPIIVVSGFERTANYASQLLMNDADAFVEKPFSADHRRFSGPWMRCS